MKRTGWMVALLAVACVALPVEGCVRKPDDGPCAEGATRCSANGSPQACHANQWYRTDPIVEGCANGRTCCLTGAPYDAGTHYACARRCLSTADASVGDGGAR